VRERGNGSRAYPKKPWRIKFDKKQNVLDAPAKAKKWTLINNYGDRTLMRNKVAFEMSRVVGMEYTPYCTFVDVIYNGEYEGCYQLCDQVEAKSGRVELTEMLPEDVEGDALTGGYFIEIDAYANQEESWFTSAGGIPVTIKTPDEDEIVREQSLYIEDHFNKLESALFSSDFTDEELGYRRYLDLESFLKYFIICELDGNLDSFWSTYMKKERGDERFHVGPVWDVDLGFQNYGSPYPVDNMSDFLYTHQDASKANGMERFVSRIVKEDPLAAFQLNRLWFELRSDGTLSYEYFDQLIDQWAAELDESQRLNFTRWPILNQSVQKGQRVFGSYQGEINNVKSYLKARFPKLDSFFGYDELLAGITDISADGDSTTYPVEIYDLSGRRIKSSSLTPGIYIRRQGPKTEKFIVR
ncbi:MAG: CotH kinase family protein, partial [Paramuribaculum sp.]|nr:CotH kinase family protein [Paramuribaculum sp.]